MNPVVASDKLKRTEVWAEDDESVHWAGAFAVYGGHGATASSTIVYEIEPGKRLGWHTDATEETQYIIAGTGKPSHLLPEPHISRRLLQYSFTAASSRSPVPFGNDRIRSRTPGLPNNRR